MSLSPRRLPKHPAVTKVWGLVTSFGTPRAAPNQPARGADYEAALARVRNGLPAHIAALRHQWLGHVNTGCNATHGVHEACDFSCTACYLSSTANKTPPLPLDEVKAQLDLIRAHAGPRAKTQITAGEVTLLPKEDLAEIVRYANGVGLDPMVMTHGQTFDLDRSYLPHLMRAGLAKVAIHVDSTQRGRVGQSKSDTEAELMLVRDRFADLVREARANTGLPLDAAHTFTVTQDNLSELPDVMRWFGKNADAFRMISFQPTADVGRTRIEDVRVADQVWDKICEGAGTRLNPHTFVQGHPDCSNVCLAFVVRFGDEVKFVEVKREDHAMDAFFFDQLSRGDSWQGFHLDGFANQSLGLRLADLIRRAPRYVWQWPLFSLYRLFGEREWIPRFVKAAALGQHVSVQPTIIIVHNFMSRDELETERGRERLEACAFKLPVDGKMVSMCELNGTGMRAGLNRATQERLGEGALVQLKRKRA